MIEYVDIHKTSIASLEPKLEEYRSYLSKDEQLRASRFKKVKDQKKHMLVRGYLRWLLSQKTGENPREIKLVYGLKGKPELPRNQYFFNLSHSRQQVLIALCPFTPVGVDIEEHRKVQGLAHSLFFNKEEQDYLQHLDPNKKVMGMLWLWTRKEALCKASGEGLTSDLNIVSLIKDHIIYKGETYQIYSEYSESEAFSICIQKC